MLFFYPPPKKAPKKTVLEVGYIDEVISPDPAFDQVPEATVALADDELAWAADWEMEEPDSVEGHGCEWYGYETWNPEESWDEPASEHHDVPKVDSDTEYWDKLRTAKTLELGETSDGEAKDPEIEPKYLDDANKPEVPMTVEYNWDDYHWWHGYGLEQEQPGCTDRSLDGDFSAELEALLDAEENPDPEDQ